MSLNAWRTIAIIFMILALTETALIGYGLYLNNKAEFELNYCYYDVCLEYPEAMYHAPICTCFNTDLYGNVEVAKEVFIN